MYEEEEEEEEKKGSIFTCGFVRVIEMHALLPPCRILYMWRRRRRQSIAAPSSVVRRGGGVARGWEGASITIQTSSVVSRGGERMRDTQHGGGGRERESTSRSD